MNTAPPSGHIVTAGGAGFLGISLAKHLASLGRSIVILSRSAPKISGEWRHVSWDARTLGPGCTTLKGARRRVNLTGRTVDCVRTPDHKNEILRSRVESTRVLGHAMRLIDSPPSVWVQISTAHIYGDPPEAVCDQSAALGSGFAPFVGRAWEEASYASALTHERKVVLRTSFVIGRDQGVGCGALRRVLPRRLIESQFEFKFPDLRSAFAELDLQ